MLKAECLDISVSVCEEQEHFISQLELNIWRLGYFFSQTVNLISFHLILCSEKRPLFSREGMQPA